MAQRSSFSTDAKIFRNALLTIALILLIGYGAVTLMGSGQLGLAPEPETQPTQAVNQNPTDGASAVTPAQTDATSDSTDAQSAQGQQADDEATDMTSADGLPDDDSRPSRGARQTAIALGTPMPEGGPAGGQRPGMGSMDASARETAIAQGTTLPGGESPATEPLPAATDALDPDVSLTAIAQGTLMPDAGMSTVPTPVGMDAISIAPLRLTAIALGTFTFDDDTPSDVEAPATPMMATTPVPSSTPPSATALGPTSTPVSAPAGMSTDDLSSIVLETEVAPIAPGQSLFAVTAAGDAKLYDRPAGDVIEELGAGMSVDALARSDDGLWTLVQSADSAGWIPIDELVIFGAEALPVISELESSSGQTTTDQAAAQSTSQTQPQPATIVPVQPTDVPSANGEPTHTGVYIDPIIASVASKNNRLNVRSGPGTDFDVLARLNPGDQYVALARTTQGDWVQLALPETDEGSGWASTPFLDLSDSVDALPVSDGFGSETPAVELPTPTAAPTPTPLAAATIAPASISDQTDVVAPPATLAGVPVTLREGPGMEFDVVKDVTSGLDFIEMERSEDGQWARIAILEPPGGVGWTTVASVGLASSQPASSQPMDDEETPTNSTMAGPTPSIMELLAPTPTAQPTAASVPLSDASEDGEPTSTPPDAAASGPVAPTPVESDVTATVISDNAYLNVRSGPDIERDVTTQVEPGESLAVLGRDADGEWIHVRTSGDVTGWVAADFVDISVPVEQLDVLSEDAMPDTDTSEELGEGVDTAEPVDSTAALDPPKFLPIVGSDASLSTSKTAAAPGGILVFEDANGGTIYGYDLTSGRLWTISSGFDPAISPDGTSVAFTRDGGANGLYRVDIDGGNEQLIFSGGQRLASPKWSPDGEKIVFSHGLDAYQCVQMGRGGCTPVSELGDRPLPDDVTPVTWINYHLAVVDSYGDKHHELATLDTARAPDWNEAGIVYQSDAGLQRTTDEANLGSQEIISDYLKPIFHDPDWQPGGGRIVYMSKEGSHWEIFSVNPDGSDVQALTRPQTALVDEIPSNVAPAWSPDGASIVFMSNRSDDGEAGEWRLWLMDADGANQRPLPIDIALDYSFGVEQMVSWAH